MIAGAISTADALWLAAGAILATNTSILFIPSVWTITSMVASIAFLGMALKTLPVGTAYAIWTGIGAIGVATLGIVLFSESASPARLACIALIIAGVVGLKLVSAN